MLIILPCRHVYFFCLEKLLNRVVLIYAYGMTKRLNGKFYTESEPNRRKLTLRLPDSLADRLEQVAGNEVAAWVRQAIAQRLQREESVDKLD